jgi:aspartate oxidase
VAFTATATVAAAVAAATAAALAVAQWLAPEKLRGCGAILLNSSGRRFVDELTTRDKVTAAIMQQVCWQQAALARPVC